MPSPLDIRCAYVLAQFGQIAPVPSTMLCRHYSAAHIGERMPAYFADVDELACAWQHEQDAATIKTSALDAAAALFATLKAKGSAVLNCWSVSACDEGAPTLWLTNPYGVDVAMHPFTLAACVRVLARMTVNAVDERGNSTVG